MSMATPDWRRQGMAQRRRMGAPSSVYSNVVPIDEARRRVQQPVRGLYQPGDRVMAASSERKAVVHSTYPDRVEGRPHRVHVVWHGDTDPDPTPYYETAFVTPPKKKRLL